MTLQGAAGAWRLRLPWVSGRGGSGSCRSWSVFHFGPGARGWGASGIPPLAASVQVFFSLSRARDRVGARLVFSGSGMPCLRNCCSGRDELRLSRLAGPSTQRPDPELVRGLEREGPTGRRSELCAFNEIPPVRDESRRGPRAGSCAPPSMEIPPVRDERRGPGPPRDGGRPSMRSRLRGRRVQP